MTASTAPTQPPDKLLPADGLDIDDWMVLAQHYQGELLKSEAAAISLRARVAKLESEDADATEYWRKAHVSQLDEIELLRAERDAALARAEKAEALNKTLELNAAEIDRSRCRVMAELEKLEKERDALKSHAYVWAGSNPFTGEQVLQLLNENDAARARLAELQAVVTKLRIALKWLRDLTFEEETRVWPSEETRLLIDAALDGSAALSHSAPGGVGEGAE